MSRVDYSSIGTWIGLLTAAIASGSATYIALRKQKFEERRAEEVTSQGLFNTYEGLINTLRAELDRSNSQIDELRIRIRAIEERLRTYEIGIVVMTNQLRSEGLEPDWEPPKEGS